MNLLIGYARVSTYEQNLEMQIDALNRVGCSKIVTDKISGSISERPGLKEILTQLRKGDTLIVWRLDRLGRTLRDLIQLVNKLEEDGINFKSIEESIDTTSATGQLIFHIFAALSEFERNLLRERTKAGMESARTRGRQGGRPKKLSKEKWQMCLDLYTAKKHSIHQICSTLSISKPTLYKYIREGHKIKL
jgi:DNA invertase Pin-like site-specific DNA recombinase